MIVVMMMVVTDADPVSGLVTAGRVCVRLATVTNRIDNTIAAQQSGRMPVKGFAAKSSMCLKPGAGITSFGRDPS